MGFLLQWRYVLGCDFKHEIKHGHTAAVIAPDFSQSRCLGSSSEPEIGEHRGGQRDLFAPGSPSPFSQFVWRAKTERERSRRVLLPGLNITEVRHLNPCPVGLACFHPVVPSKRQMPHGKSGSGLKLFIGGG